MDSGRRKAAAIQAGWANLPVELLEMISGHLQNTSEIVGFRSVCRSWRSSTAPPPNKLSPLFPLKVPFFCGESFSECGHLINVCALYLVRPRSDPSEAWIVSVQEAEAGKLVLRDPLTYQEMNADAGLEFDENRIAATQIPIAGFYTHNHHCKQCKGVKITQKVVFVSEVSSSGCRQLVGLCSFPEGNVLVGVCSCPELIPFAFRLDLGSSKYKATRLSDVYLESHESFLIFRDSVKFNGQIFVVDWEGYIWVLDHTNLQLVQMIDKPVWEHTGGYVSVKFVVSDGDLYVVWLSYRNPSACEIYRLVVVTDGNDNKKCSGLSIEQVRDLGGRVFFITYQCSFSISARLLPCPWQEGNCIFVSDFPDFSCGCARYDVEYRASVFHLGSQTFTKLYTEEGHSYLGLFSPPVSLKVEKPRGDSRFLFV